MFTVATVLNALELGFIYALVAMALFLSFRVLNIADMTTDGAFTPPPGSTVTSIQPAPSKRSTSVIGLPSSPVPPTA